MKRALKFERQESIRKQVDEYKQQGYTVEQAFGHVAKVMFLSSETIRQSYYGYGSYRRKEKA